MRFTTLNHFKYLCIALIFSFCLSPLQAMEKTLITIHQFVSHPALDSAKKGILQALQERGLCDQIEIKEDNSQGNISLAIQIAKSHAALNPNIMVAIATPSAQTLFKAKSKETMLAFVALTDPLAAELDISSNMIGVTDYPPVEKLISIATQILPKTKTIGVIYNPSEINSLKTVERLKKEIENKDLTLNKVAVHSAAQIKSATLALISDVDIIYIPQDSLVVSAIDTITRIAKAKKIPVIGNDPSLIDQGLLMTLGSDYFKSGLQLGQMIADTLEKKVISPAIQSATPQELKFNSQIAKQLGLSIPKHL